MKNARNSDCNLLRNETTLCNSTTSILPDSLISTHMIALARIMLI